jgi:hypothetical protein
MDNKNDTSKNVWFFGGSKAPAPKASEHTARISAPKALASGSARRRVSGSSDVRAPGGRRSLAAAITVSVLLLAGAVMMTILLSDGGSIAAMSFNASGNAKLTVNVAEGYTDAPIEGAKVVIMETGKTYTTDKSGNTETIEVPVIRDSRFDNIIPKPWGEISLIVYKDGFLPYALFYLQVAGGQTRSGVKILLFENNSTGNSEPFSIIEGPNRAWVDELIEKFQPTESVDISP